MCSEGKATDHMDATWCLRLARLLLVMEDQDLTKFLFIYWFGQRDLFTSTKWFSFLARKNEMADTSLEWKLWGTCSAV